MYLDHFGLAEAPFRITPHTDFFFAGAGRGATLEALIYAIANDEGIIQVGSEVGSGKTMLCRVLMERLPGHVVTIYLANPSLSRDDMLFAIAEDLQLAMPPETRLSTLLRLLQQKLIELYAAGRRVVVLIDEAHAMPAETLEEIRLLSNLESNQHKLLQLVLFGQPELDATLARPDMRQLRERITQHFTLEPLLRDDIAEYLRFRMRAAGYRGPDVFTPAAVKRIAAASLGLTRRINILADKALLAAFSENSHQIGQRQARAAIRDARYALPLWRRPRLRLAAAVALAGAVAGAAVVLRGGGFAPPPADPPPAAAAPAPTPPPALAAAAATPPPAAAPAPPAPAAAPAGPAGQGEAAAAPASAAVMTDDFGPLTRQHLQETSRWLSDCPDDHWFVQLLGHCASMSPPSTTRGASASSTATMRRGERRSRPPRNCPSRCAPAGPFRARWGGCGSAEAKCRNQRQD